VIVTLETNAVSVTWIIVVDMLKLHFEDVVSRTEFTAVLRDARGKEVTVVDDGAANTLGLAGAKPSSASIRSISAAIWSSIKRT
jgi:hypothetical protein